MREDTSFEQDVLTELGDDRLQEIADVLGADRGRTRDVVGLTVSTLSDGLRDEAAAGPAEAAEVRQAFEEEAPLQGVAALGGGLGGLLGGGTMAGLLSGLSRPVAHAVARRTGLPAATVVRVVELLIPVVLTVLSERARKAGAPRTAPAAPAAGGPTAGGPAHGGPAHEGPAHEGLGELLERILGGGGKGGDGGNGRNGGNGGK